MLKSFLVPVDGSEYSTAAAGYAATLAGREGGQVSLLSVIDITSLEGPFLADLSGSVGITPFLDFQKQVRAALEEKAALILENHAAELKERNVDFSTKVETGVVSRVICQEAAEHDAIVVGRRGEHATWKGLLLGSVVEEVVRGCARPVIVTPRDEKPLTKILVAYDGSRTASRALSLAAAMAGSHDLPVAVVTVSGDSEAGEKILDEAETFLEPHGVAVEKILETGQAVEGILAACEAANCDIIIMGAYGHSRVRELIVGSTTDGILRKAGVPVLLYR
ncbi:universal stress protein [Candidatus Moduliflexota bacterium]